MNDGELIKVFEIEFRELLARADPLVVQATPLQWWSLLSQLQLAFRHPRNQGPTKEIAGDVARQIERLVATTPALEEMARRGWLKSQDVPIGRNRHQRRRAARELSRRRPHG